MKRSMTALAAAVLTFGLTAAAYAGHPPAHHDDHHDDQRMNHDDRRIDNLKMDHDRKHDDHERLVRHDRKDRLRLADSHDFKYRRWVGRCHTYLFWCPSYDCWYYWYPPSDCYLPYDQIDTYPPDADVVPQASDDLPLPVPGEDDGGPAGLPPVMPPADGPGN